MFLTRLINRRRCPFFLVVPVILLVIYIYTSPSSTISPISGSEGEQEGYWQPPYGVGVPSEVDAGDHIVESLDYEPDSGQERQWPIPGTHRGNHWREVRNGPGRKKTMEWLDTIKLPMDKNAEKYEQDEIKNSEAWIKKNTLPRIQHDFKSYKETALNTLRRERVKKAFYFAWSNYRDQAMGYDEIMPCTGKPNEKANFNAWGATLIDSLDTLLILGFSSEFDKARVYAGQVNFSQTPINNGYPAQIPVFETTIRYLGGLTAAYDLSGDELLLHQARKLGVLLTQAFNTLSGIPHGYLSADSKGTMREGTGQILAEVALELEFTRLAQVTQDPSFAKTVQKCMESIFKLDRSNWLDKKLPPKALFDTWDPQYSVGSQADSYFEYHLKQWLLLRGDGSMYQREYENFAETARKHLEFNVTSIPGFDLVTQGNIANGRLQPTLEHLVCFAGGMYGMGSKVFPNRGADMALALKFSDTCFFAYNHTITGIAPENLQFAVEPEFDTFYVQTEGRSVLRDGGIKYIDTRYMGRPETIESIYYMFRLTGDDEWRGKGWTMFESWMLASRADFGFSGLDMVIMSDGAQSNGQESFVFAETFKYYYLLFSHPQYFSLDDWVFSTEAHPFSLRNSDKAAGGFWSGRATADEISNSGKGTPLQLKRIQNEVDRLAEIQRIAKIEGKFNEGNRGSLGK